MEPRRPFQRSWTTSTALCFLAILGCLAGPPRAAAQGCGAQGVAVQVLGSGGPELQDKRASSSYLVWLQGSALRFGQSGAQMAQLDALLFTHFHVDHTADFGNRG
jgi:hypothetical protein